MQVRAAVAADLVSIQRITTLSPTAPQWTAAQFQEALRESPSSAVRRTTFVAEASASAGKPQILGFAVISALIAVYPVEAELESIAVDPQSRGQGAGQALLQAAEAWAAGLQTGPEDGGETPSGTTLLRLEVRSSNVPALRLYQRAGFLPTAVRPAYYTNPVEDALCMERTIPQKDVHASP